MRSLLKSIWNKIRASQSLRSQVLLAIMLVGIAPTFILRYGILESYERRAVTVKTTEASQQLMIIANHLINYAYLQGSNSDVINAELSQISNLYDGRVLIINSNFKVLKDTYGISEGKTIISEEVIKCFLGETTSNYDQVHGYIEILTPIVSTTMSNLGQDAVDTGESMGVEGVMLTSVSTDSIARTLALLERQAQLLQIIMIVIIFGIAVLLSILLVRPFERVTQAINEVKGGFSNQPIEVDDYVETRHILEAFNQLLSRMRVIDESREEFVSNVSHELKTPLTSMKVLADSLVSQDEAPVELYREFMEDITKEIDRENAIINDLLALVKMDRTVGDLNVNRVDVNAMTELVLKRLRPIARKRDIEVTFESTRQVTADVDEVKMTMIISNLVENAIKYNHEHGWVKVVLDADHKEFTLSVSDSGVGIPEAAQDHIFERFYRVDKSHSREIGGTGLGLAITKNAVLMHRGAIKVSSKEGEGATFTVTVPLIYKA